jgi:REP element-mobilizing transposase RayT
MARPLRVDIPKGVYHVTARGLEKRRIVRDRADRQKWMELLSRVATRRDWQVYAWALLENHYHIFLRVPHADLSHGMHDLNAGYAIVFNRRHRRCGSLFQGRFKGILVQEEYHYWELTRYVHLNPVRAGLVSDPEAYPWSSCGFYFQRRSAPSWLAWEEILGEHGASLGEAELAYRRFLREGLSKDCSSPLDKVTASTLLGSPAFIERMKARLQEGLPEREVPAARKLRVSLAADEVVEAVCTNLNVDRAHVLCKRTRSGRARAIAMYLCRNMTRCALQELGGYFGGVNAQSVSNAFNRIHQERQRNMTLDQQLGVIESSLVAKV